jgi:uncharacterized protein YecE (DUF72 family)
MRTWIGTSGYSYPEWEGTFYPADLPSAKMLSYYAGRFSTVEVNNTFYRMPSAKSIAGWAAATPKAFTFALKAPKRITHDARLKNVEDPLRTFCETARLLGPKLGPLLFQLPPYFRKDARRLGDVLSLIPPGLSVAFEFRHPSWFSDDVYDLLRSKNSALCVADTEKGTTPLVATAAFGYFRLRDEGYSEENLKIWSETIRRLEFRWTDAFIFFKHEESGIGPALARRFRELLNA